MGNLSNVCDCSLERARLEYDIYFYSIGNRTRTHNLFKISLLPEKRLSGKIEFLSQKNIRQLKHIFTSLFKSNLSSDKHNKMTLVQISHHLLPVLRFLPPPFIPSTSIEKYRVYMPSFNNTLSNNVFMPFI